MPELPEVETVRRALQSTVVGRTVEAVRVSRLRLREGSLRPLTRLLAGRAIRGVRRRGKFLLIDLDAGLTLLSHLGMSGRWLFDGEGTGDRLDHVHIRVAFRGGGQLRFQDPRRFGLARVIRTADESLDPALAKLGPDPIADPPTGPRLARAAAGLSVSVKVFLMDQRRIAGIGNIYASEILHRAAVDPRRRAGRVRPREWALIATHTTRVLREAIGGMGTTFSMYRTLWNQPGQYGERLMVYDRAGEPCRTCATPIRRIVQGQRSTFYCSRCQA